MEALAQNGCRGVSRPVPGGKYLPLYPLGCAACHVGRTYRFTAWAEDETALKSVFLLLVDSTGYPIRRPTTQRGHVSHGEQPLDATLDDILSTKRDTADGCRGDTQASVVYKAEESATFQVGVGHTIGECPSASPFPLHSPCFAEVLLVPFCECSSASPCCVPELLLIVAKFCFCSGLSGALQF